MRAHSGCAVLAVLLVGAAALCQPEPDPAPLSPGEALTVFLEAAHAGDFARASAFLSLAHLPEERRAPEGPRLARRLMFLLDQQLTFEPRKLAQHDEATADAVVVGELTLRRLLVPVELVRQPPGAAQAWLFGPRTVRVIDALFDEHGSALWEALPHWLTSHSLWVLGAWQWLGLLLVLALAWVLARLVTAGTARVLTRLARLSTTPLDDQLLERLARPARVILFLAAVGLGTRALAFPVGAQAVADDLARSAVVATLVWALLVVNRLVSEAIEVRASRDGDGNSARTVKTQVAVLNRVVSSVVLVVGGALVLLQFPGVRHIGMSLLASAGVVGVVVGLAAQRSISNLLAGIQISVTQPIRIGDTVVVEKETGSIEEITLTYVVVKVWDLRRLVVPIATFLEKPFQNWSRVSPELLGVVELYADYRVDVEAARAELHRVLELQRGKLWNGQVQKIEVTAMSERTVTLRALVSADDASKSWELRCLVRERLVEWLKHQPGALPRLRTEGGAPASAPGELD